MTPRYGADFTTFRLHNNLPTLSSAPGIVPERVFDNPTSIRNPTGHLHCVCLQITKESPLWRLDGIWESFPSQIRYFDSSRDTATTKPNFYFSRNPVLPKLNSTPLFQRLPGSFTNNETHIVTTMRMSQYYILPHNSAPLDSCLHKHLSYWNDTCFQQIHNISPPQL